MKHGDWVTCVAICDSGSMIVSGSRDGTVCRWNIETDAMIGDYLRGLRLSVECVAVDEKGKMIVSGQKNTLVRWDAKTGKQLGEPMCGHSKDVTCVAISPCGELIVSGSSDRTLRMWDTVNGKLKGVPFRGHSSRDCFVGFTAESGIIVSATDDGTTHQWRMVSSTRISESTEGCDGVVKDIVFIDDGQKFVTYSSKSTLLQWDVKSGMPIGKPMRPELENSYCRSINDKGGMILAVYVSYWGVKNGVIWWNKSTCEMIGDPIVLESGCRLSCAAVTSKGKMIVTGSEDGTVQRYCASSGHAIGESMRGHQEKVSCVAFSSIDELIVTGSKDSSIIRWTTDTGKQIREPLIHNGPVECLSVSDDGTAIASLTSDGVLRRWDAISGRLICQSVTKERYGRFIWTNNDCTKILITSSDKITCWNVGPGGTILKTFTLPLPDGLLYCSVSINLGVAVVVYRSEFATSMSNSTRCLYHTV